MLIGRNEVCPCGSGKKYKNCCYGKDEDEIRNNQFLKLYKDARHKSQFKECLHPDKSKCTEKIIKAHTIQKNRFLSNIAENGKVLMPCPKPDLSFVIMNEYGLANASIFTGFCDYHDKTTFQPIEDKPFIGSQEQVFLFTYRSFALEYYKKRAGNLMIQSFSNSIDYVEPTIDDKNALQIAIMDFEEEKMIFDDALLSNNFDVVSSVIWEFDGESNFAATGGEAISYDATLQLIQNLANLKKCARHIYYSAFSENGKTFFVISWLKEYDNIFEKHRNILNSFTLQERKNYVNNTLAISTENIAIRPSSWKSMSNEQIQAYGMLFFGMIDFSESMGQPYDRKQNPGFDLFSI